MVASVKHLLKEGSQYAVRGTLWIECDNDRFFGPGRVELLQRIDQTRALIAYHDQLCQRFLAFLEKETNELK